MSVVDRINEFRIFKGLTMQKFEKSVGFSNGAFGSQVKNKGNIGSDKLENILTIYNDLDGYWALTGKGSMVRSNTKVLLSEPDTDYVIDKGSGLRGILFEDQEQINTKLDIILKKIDDLSEINEDIADIKTQIQRLALLDDVAEEIKKIEKP